MAAFGREWHPVRNAVPSAAPHAYYTVVDGVINLRNAIGFKVSSHLLVSTTTSICVGLLVNIQGWDWGRPAHPSTNIHRFERDLIALAVQGSSGSKNFGEDGDGTESPRYRRGRDIPVIFNT